VSGGKLKYTLLYVEILLRFYLGLVGYYGSCNVGSLSGIGHPSLIGIIASKFVITGRWDYGSGWEAFTEILYVS